MRALRSGGDECTDHPRCEELPRKKVSCFSSCSPQSSGGSCARLSSSDQPTSSSSCPSHRVASGAPPPTQAREPSVYPATERDSSSPSESPGPDLFVDNADSKKLLAVTPRPCTSPPRNPFKGLPRRVPTTGVTCPSFAEASSSSSPSPPPPSPLGPAYSEDAEASLSSRGRDVSQGEQGEKASETRRRRRKSAEGTADVTREEGGGWGGGGATEKKKKKRLEKPRNSENQLEGGRGKARVVWSVRQRKEKNEEGEVEREEAAGERRKRGGGEEEEGESSWLSRSFEGSLKEGRTRGVGGQGAGEREQGEGREEQEVEEVACISQRADEAQDEERKEEAEREKQKTKTDVSDPREKNSTELLGSRKPKRDDKNEDEADTARQKDLCPFQREDPPFFGSFSEAAEVSEERTDRFLLPVSQEGIEEGEEEEEEGRKPLGRRRGRKEKKEEVDELRAEHLKTTEGSEWRSAQGDAGERALLHESLAKHRRLECRHAAVPSSFNSSFFASPPPRRLLGASWRGSTEGASDMVRYLNFQSSCLFLLLVEVDLSLFLSQIYTHYMALFLKPHAPSSGSLREQIQRSGEKKRKDKEEDEADVTEKPTSPRGVGEDNRRCTSIDVKSEATQLHIGEYGESPLRERTGRREEKEERALHAVSLFSSASSFLSYRPTEDGLSLPRRPLPTSRSSSCSLGSSRGEGSMTYILHFPPLPSFYRRLIHLTAERFRLSTQSSGWGEERSVSVSSSLPFLARDFVPAKARAKSVQASPKTSLSPVGPVEDTSTSSRSTSPPTVSSPSSSSSSSSRSPPRSSVGREKASGRRGRERGPGDRGVQTDGNAFASSGEEEEARQEGASEREEAAQHLGRDTRTSEGAEDVERRCPARSQDSSADPRGEGRESKNESLGSRGEGERERRTSRVEGLTSKKENGESFALETFLDGFPVTPSLSLEDFLPALSFAVSSSRQHAKRRKEEEEGRSRRREEEKKRMSTTWRELTGCAEEAKEDERCYAVGSGERSRGQGKTLVSREKDPFSPVVTSSSSCCFSALDRVVEQQIENSGGGGSLKLTAELFLLYRGVRTQMERTSEAFFESLAEAVHQRRRELDERIIRRGQAARRETANRAKEEAEEGRGRGGEGAEERRGRRESMKAGMKRQGGGARGLQVKSAEGEEEEESGEGEIREDACEEKTKKRAGMTREREEETGLDAEKDRQHERAAKGGGREEEEEEKSGKEEERKLLQFGAKRKKGRGFFSWVKNDETHSRTSKPSLWSEGEKKEKEEEKKKEVERKIPDRSRPRHDSCQGSGWERESFSPADCISSRPLFSYAAFTLSSSSSFRRENEGERHEQERGFSFSRSVGRQSSRMLPCRQVSLLLPPAAVQRGREGGRAERQSEGSSSSSSCLALVISPFARVFFHPSWVLSSSTFPAGEEGDDTVEEKEKRSPFFVSLNRSRRLDFCFRYGGRSRGPGGYGSESAGPGETFSSTEDGRPEREGASSRCQDRSEVKKEEKEKEEESVSRVCGNREAVGQGARRSEDGEEREEAKNCEGEREVGKFVVSLQREDDRSDEGTEESDIFFDPECSVLSFTAEVYKPFTVCLYTREFFLRCPQYASSACSSSPSSASGVSLPGSGRQENFSRKRRGHQGEDRCRSTLLSENDKTHRYGLSRGKAASSPLSESRRGERRRGRTSSSPLCLTLVLDFHPDRTSQKGWIVHVSRVYVHRKQMLSSSHRHPLLLQRGCGRDKCPCQLSRGERREGLRTSTGLHAREQVTGRERIGAGEKKAEEEEKEEEEEDADLLDACLSVQVRDAWEIRRDWEGGSEACLSVRGSSAPSPRSGGCFSVQREKRGRRGSEERSWLIEQEGREGAEKAGQDEEGILPERYAGQAVGQYSESDHQPSSTSSLLDSEGKKAEKTTAEKQRDSCRVRKNEGGEGEEEEERKTCRDLCLSYGESEERRSRAVPYARSPPHLRGRDGAELRPDVEKSPGEWQTPSFSDPHVGTFFLPYREEDEAGGEDRRDGEEESKKKKKKKTKEAQSLPPLPSGTPVSIWLAQLPRPLAKSPAATSFKSLSTTPRPSPPAGKCRRLSSSPSSSSPTASFSSPSSGSTCCTVWIGRGVYPLNIVGQISFQRTRREGAASGFVSYSREKASFSADPSGDSKRRREEKGREGELGKEARALHPAAVNPPLPVLQERRKERRVPGPHQEKEEEERENETSFILRGGKESKENRGDGEGKEPRGPRNAFEQARQQSSLTKRLTKLPSPSGARCQVDGKALQRQETKFSGNPGEEKGTRPAKEGTAEKDLWRKPCSVQGKDYGRHQENAMTAREGEEDARQDRADRGRRGAEEGKGKEEEEEVHSGSPSEGPALAGKRCLGGGEERARRRRDEEVCGEREDAPRLHQSLDPRRRSYGPSLPPGGSSRCGVRAGQEPFFFSFFAFGMPPPPPPLLADGGGGDLRGERETGKGEEEKEFWMKTREGTVEDKKRAEEAVSEDEEKKKKKTLLNSVREDKKTFSSLEKIEETEMIVTRNYGPRTKTSPQLRDGELRPSSSSFHARSPRVSPHGLIGGKTALLRAVAEATLSSSLAPPRMRGGGDAFRRKDALFASPPCKREEEGPRTSGALVGPSPAFVSSSGRESPRGEGEGERGTKRGQESEGRTTTAKDEERPGKEETPGRRRRTTARREEEKEGGEEPCPMREDRDLSGPKKTNPETRWTRGLKADFHGEREGKGGVYAMTAREREGYQQQSYQHDSFRGVCTLCTAAMSRLGESCPQHHVIRQIKVFQDLAQVSGLSPLRKNNEEEEEEEKETGGGGHDERERLSDPSTTSDPEWISPVLAGRDHIVEIRFSVVARALERFTRSEQHARAISSSLSQRKLKGPTSSPGTCTEERDTKRNQLPRKVTDEEEGRKRRKTGEDLEGELGGEGEKEEDEKTTNKEEEEGGRDPRTRSKEKRTGEQGIQVLRKGLPETEIGQDAIREAEGEETTKENERMEKKEEEEEEAERGGGEGAGEMFRKKSLQGKRFAPCRSSCSTIPEEESSSLFSCSPPSPSFLSFSSLLLASPSSCCGRAGGHDAAVFRVRCLLNFLLAFALERRLGPSLAARAESTDTAEEEQEESPRGQREEVRPRRLTGAWSDRRDDEEEEEEEKKKKKTSPGKLSGRHPRSNPCLILRLRGGRRERTRDTRRHSVTKLRRRGSAKEGRGDSAKRSSTRRPHLIEEGNSRERTEGKEEDEGGEDEEEEGEEEEEDEVVYYAVCVSPQAARVVKFLILQWKRIHQSLSAFSLSAEPSKEDVFSRSNGKLLPSLVSSLPGLFPSCPCCSLYASASPAPKRALSRQSSPLLGCLDTLQVASLSGLGFLPPCQDCFSPSTSNFRGVQKEEGEEEETQPPATNKRDLKKRVESFSSASCSPSGKEADAAAFLYRFSADRFPLISRRSRASLSSLGSAFIGPSSFFSSSPSPSTLPSPRPPLLAATAMTVGGFVGAGDRDVWLQRLEMFLPSTVREFGLTEVLSTLQEEKKRLLFLKGRSDSRKARRMHASQRKDARLQQTESEKEKEEVKKKKKKSRSPEEGRKDDGGEVLVSTRGDEGSGKQNNGREGDEEEKEEDVESGDEDDADDIQGSSSVSSSEAEEEEEEEEERRTVLRLEVRSAMRMIAHNLPPSVERDTVISKYRDLQDLSPRKNEDRKEKVPRGG